MTRKILSHAVRIFRILKRLVLIDGRALILESHAPSFVNNTLHFSQASCDRTAHHPSMINVRQVHLDVFVVILLLLSSLSTASRSSPWLRVLTTAFSYEGTSETTPICAADPHAVTLTIRHLFYLKKEARRKAQEQAEVSLRAHRNSDREPEEDASLRNWLQRHFHCRTNQRISPRTPNLSMKHISTYFRIRVQFARSCSFPPSTISLSFVLCLEISSNNITATLFLSHDHTIDAFRLHVRTISTHNKNETV